MQNAINDQINAELWSAYLYLSMAMDAESKMLKGIANWFFIQWLEEQDHARIFQNYLNDHGAKVRLQWFVDEQIEEEKNAADIIVLLERADKDMAFLHKIDDTLAQRRYEKPDVLPPIPD